jgi:RecA/RadA recombinase
MGQVADVNARIDAVVDAGDKTLDAGGDAVRKLKAQRAPSHLVRETEGKVEALSEALSSLDLEDIAAAAVALLQALNAAGELCLTSARKAAPHVAIIEAALRPTTSSAPEGPVAPGSTGPVETHESQALPGAEPLQYALSYAAAGLPVLPVDPMTKRPLGGHGIDHATCDPDVIAEWLRRWPNAALGIHLAGAGLCAVDIDPRNGATKTPADFPPTLTASTGGGGHHLIYRVPEGLELPGKLSAGVDLKWRGYIIVEPSGLPSGGQYRWVDADAPSWGLVGLPSIADFPASLLERSAPSSPPANPPAVTEGRVTEGGRNEFLSREAYALRKKGLGPDAILKTVSALNSAACVPPLDESEVRAIAEGKRKIEPDVLRHSSGAERSDRFRVIGYEEMTKLVSRGWLVKHLIPLGALVLVIGQSSSGKTFFVLDLVGAVVRGGMWRDRKVKSALRVVYICAEGQGGFVNRMTAYARHNGLPSLGIGVIPDNPNLLQREDVGTLIAQLKAYGRVDLIVLDTWAQMTAGGDENAGQDMGRALAHCKAIQRATGAAIVLIHHVGKDATRGARGWSGLRAAADTEIEITELEAMRVAKVTKQKDGADGSKFAFKLRTVPVGMDEDGEVIESCVVEYVDDAPAARTRAAPRGDVERIVLKAAHDLVGQGGEPPTVQDVIEEAISTLPTKDRARFRVQRALERLQSREYLSTRDGVVQVQAG